MMFLSMAALNSVNALFLDQNDQIDNADNACVPPKYRN